MAADGSTSIPLPRPFLKWVGGKRQLLPALLPALLLALLHRPQCPLPHHLLCLMAWGVLPLFRRAALARRRPLPLAWRLAVSLARAHRHLKVLLAVGRRGSRISLAKSWLSEHLAAAVNGDSTKVVQGTAGTTEEQIRYSWNYAMLIAHGPSHEALIKSPIFRAMESGSLARFEEVTRCASEVQDAMISRLSEKRLSVPELETEIPAAKGFSVIATANTRDRGVNDMSAALKRRFNIIVLPTPNTLETEMDIVRKRVGELAVNLDLKAELPAADAIEKVVTIFRELRLGQTLDGKNKLKTPSGVLSTAEAISVLANSMALAGHFGSGEVTARDIAAGLQGSVVKDEAKDKVIWDEYLANVMKKRGADWRPLYTSCTEHNS